MNDYLITVDVDWASDYMIKEVSDYLIENRVKSTWFITHDSPVIRKLLKHPLFEIGIHPNFDKDSTQGTNPKEIMRNLKNIVNTPLVRTHKLIQSSELLEMMRKNFGIRYDLSLLLPYTPNIVPNVTYLSKGNGIIRFPFFWEDDIEMYNPNPSFRIYDKKYHVNGLKIFNFHPIHIMENFMVDSVYDGPGTFFCKMVNFIKPGKFISELVE